MKRQEKENNEINECTFQPNKGKKNKTKKVDFEEMIENLYKDGLEKIIEKNKLIKKRKIDEEKDKDKCNEIEIEKEKEKEKEKLKEKKNINNIPIFSVL